jgi:transcriptional regulator with XRE-family HTH domain
MSIAIIFGRILQEKRQEKGLSQEQLAQICSLDRTYISLLERGLRQPTLNTLFSISKGLNINPSVFIKLIEERYETSD